MNEEPKNIGNESYPIYPVKLKNKTVFDLAISNEMTYCLSETQLWSLYNSIGKAFTNIYFATDGVNSVAGAITTATETPSVAGLKNRE